MFHRLARLWTLAAGSGVLLTACGGVGTSPSGGATGSDSPSTGPGSSGEPGGASGYRDSITWVLDGQPIYTVGMTAVAGWPTPFPDAPPTLDDCHPAAYDADVTWTADDGPATHTVTVRVA